jgi:hypothetical protein
MMIEVHGGEQSKNNIVAKMIQKWTLNLGNSRPSGPVHPGGGQSHPQQQGGGSYWDWLKSGGGLNPNNPYHPFPGIPGTEGIRPIEVPAFGYPFSDDRNIS